MLRDGGFEASLISGFAYNPTGGAWVFSPASGNNGSGITTNGSLFTGSNARAIPEGKQAAFLQGTGIISQMLDGLIPGATYHLTFSVAQRMRGNEGIKWNQQGQTWQVRLDGRVIGEYSPSQSATHYTDYSARFTAMAPRQVLSFVGTNTRGEDNTVFIDHVRISPAQPAR